MIKWIRERLPLSGFVLAVFIVGSMIGAIYGSWKSLPSPHIASWVQAFGTITAVIIAGVIAVWQVKRNHELAILRQNHEHSRMKKALAASMVQIAEDALWYIDFFHKQVDSLNKVHHLPVQTFNPFSFEATINTLSSIRFNELPPELVEPVMRICHAVHNYISSLNDVYKLQSDMNKELHSQYLGMYTNAKKMIMEEVGKLRAV